MKLAFGILCLILAIPIGYFLWPRNRERQPGDRLTAMHAIGATIAIIGLGITLILWQMDKG